MNVCIEESILNISDPKTDIGFETFGPYGNGPNPLKFVAIGISVSHFAFV